MRPSRDALSGSQAPYSFLRALLGDGTALERVVKGAGGQREG